MPAGGDDHQALADQWRHIDDDSTMLTLEFMRNGDLHHLITKLAKTGGSVPQPVLWRILFCRESCSPACLAKEPFLVVVGALAD